MKTRLDYVAARPDTGNLICRYEGNDYKDDPTRHRSTYNSPSFSHYQTGSSYSCTWPAYTARLEYATEDELGSKKKWKNWQHYKSVLLNTSSARGLRAQKLAGTSSSPHFYENPNGDFTEGFASSGGSFPWGDPGQANPSGVPSLCDPAQETDLISAPSELPWLTKLALRTMLPGIKQHISYLNHLLENSEFLELPGQLIKVSRSLQQVSRFRHLWKKRKTLGALFKDGSGIYLQQMFGTIPFVNDMCGLYRALTSYQKQVNNLLTNEGKVVTRHFTWIYDELGNQSGTSGHYAPMIGTYGSGTQNLVQSYEAKSDPSRFHAMMEYNYTLSGYERANAQGLGLLDSIGYNLNPAIIWNAIPFSFLIDWVANVGNFLSDTKQRNIEPKVNIHRFLWSIKRRRTITYITRMYNVNPYKFASRAEGTLVRVETSYRRSVGIPARSWFETSGLSLKELTLGAALALANRGNRRPRRY